MQLAEACLNKVIAEVNNKQDVIAKPLLEQKKQKLQQLSEQLKIIEEIGKTFNASKGNSIATDVQLSTRTAPLLFSVAVTKNDLQLQISTLENALKVPQTRPVVIVNSVYTQEVTTNNRPLLTLGLCLALGVFLGLFITAVVRAVQEVRLHMRETESRAR